MTKTALCGLGQAASNPVVTTLANFLPEYEAHIHDKYCPSAECKGLFAYTILPDRCSGCGLCVEVCSTNAIEGKRREPYTLDASRCIQCRNCVVTCARNAIVGLPIPFQAETDFDYELIA
jgi:ferredoxin